MTTVPYDTARPGLTSARTRGPITVCLKDQCSPPLSGVLANGKEGLPIGGFANTGTHVLLGAKTLTQALPWRLLLYTPLLLNRVCLDPKNLDEQPLPGSDSHQDHPVDGPVAY